MKLDYVIIGGGIVGVSTAWQLQQRFPDKKIAIIEKEHQFACHQTGHNSGVIHAGVYYQPGSLKAKFCKEGVQATIKFCQDNGIAYEQCGKLLVATNEIEKTRMLALYERCAQNGIDVELLDEAQLKLREPNIQGVGAIFVKQTGIVNYQDVTTKMAEKFQQLGGDVLLEHEVVGLKEDANGVLELLETGRYLQIQEIQILKIF